MTTAAHDDAGSRFIWGNMVPLLRTRVRDIAATVHEHESLTMLARALTAAALEGMLRQQGPFTVFAPNDNAFFALPEETLNDLLKNGEQLRDILAYHIVAGRFRYDDIKKMQSLNTVSGENLSLNTSDDLVVNNARIVLPDIECANGLVHIIDLMLIPGL